MNPLENKPLREKMAALISPVAKEQTEQEVDQILTFTKGRIEEALELARKRAEGAPLGLALGIQNFLGVTLKTRDGVLAAREETEILGREAITILQSLTAQTPSKDFRVIDMGCGSGNLACAIANAFPNAHVWASDITASCASLAQENANLLGLSSRIRVSQGDLFEPLKGQGWENTVDMVVMNPPYIPSTSLAKTHAGLLKHEPREAFDGGPYGISVLTRLMEEAPLFLKPAGYLLFEFGLGQVKVIRSLLDRKNLYSHAQFATDANGHERSAILKK